MSKRILKRHKRQVLRAKARGSVSEPDVRTPEQIRAAREASRPTGVGRKGPPAYPSSPPVGDHPTPVPGTAEPVDG
jgi:hypothetical protein